MREKTVQSISARTPASGDDALYLHAFARQRVLVIATTAITIIDMVHAKSLANMVLERWFILSHTHTIQNVEHLRLEF